MSKRDLVRKEDLSVSQIIIEFLQCVTFYLLKIMQIKLYPFAGGAIVNKTTGIASTLGVPINIKRLIQDDADLRAIEKIQDCIISVIIPTYNEEASIIKTIDSILGGQNINNTDNLIEIVISDGGSSDRTLEVSQNHLESLRPKVRFVVTSGGTNRGESQNIGAIKSSGSIVLFLHADSLLPDNWQKLVRDAMADKKNLAGCFKFELFLSGECSGPISSGIKNIYSKFLTRSVWQSFCIHVLELGTNLRSKYFHLPYGDQALFFRKSIFLDCFHGFQSTALLEDYDFIRKVRQYGKIITVAGAVRTSGRRWEINGFFWNTFLNQVHYSGN